MVIQSISISRPLTRTLATLVMQYLQEVLGEIRTTFLLAHPPLLFLLESEARAKWEARFQCHAVALL
jgi:hypothetical protein